MSRFMHPSSVRYGTLENWAVLGEKLESSYESKEFLKYIDHLIYKHMTADLSTILGECRVVYGKNSIMISIPLYDRLLELSLRDGVIKRLEETVLYDRLLFIKKLIIVEGYKYFGVPVEVEFYFLSLCGMPSLMLSRYIALYLEQNKSLTEVFKHVSGEFLGKVKKQDAVVGGLLVHKRRSSFASNLNQYKPRLIGEQLLLGYRLDCKGRFSRKQRASRESLIIGSVSLGGFKGYLDYGSASAIMTYGVSNIRVWKYLDRYEQEWNYLLKVK